MISVVISQGFWNRLNRQTCAAWSSAISTVQSTDLARSTPQAAGAASDSGAMHLRIALIPNGLPSSSLASAK